MVSDPIITGMKKKPIYIHLIIKDGSWRALKNLNELYYFYYK